MSFEKLIDLELGIQGLREQKNKKKIDKNVHTFYVSYLTISIKFTYNSFLPLHNESKEWRRKHHRVERSDKKKT